MSWTPERKEQALRLWRDGLSASQIAERLGGVSRNGVIGLVQRSGVKRAKPAAPSKPSKPAKLARPKAPPVRRAPSTGNGLNFRRGATAIKGAEAEPKRGPWVDPARIQARMDAPVEAAPCDCGPPCKWPIGDPQSPDFRFCEQPSAAGRPYCTPHAGKAFQPIPPSKPKTGNDLARSLRRYL